jgi:hypothetical protein
VIEQVHPVIVWRRAPGLLLAFPGASGSRESNPSSGAEQPGGMGLEVKLGWPSAGPFR